MIEEIALPDIDLPTTHEPAPERPAQTTRKLPTGSRVSDGNAQTLAFLGSFAAADSEALSMISHRQESRLYPGGVLPTVKGTEKRLRKLERLDCIDKQKNPATGVNHFGLTKNGIAAAWSFGYDMEHAGTMHKLSFERLNHNRMIALVAAQLISPEGYFRDSLGIEPVPLDQLWNEKKMRSAYDPTKRMLEEERANGQPGSFAQWRAAKLRDEVAAIKRAIAAAEGEQAKHRIGGLMWSSFIERNPGLLTLGLDQTDDYNGKPIYQPDLAVIRDQRRGGSRAQNLLIEVELTKKNWNTYDAILSTLKKELTEPYVYNRAVYFYVGTQIPTLIKKVDAAGEYDLIKSGRLVLIPLTHRDGTEIALKNRIETGGN